MYLDQYYFKRFWKRINAHKIFGSNKIVNAYQNGQNGRQIVIPKMNNLFTPRVPNSLLTDTSPLGIV